MDFETSALNPHLCCEIRKILKGTNEFRAAIGISAVIQRIHSDEEIECSHHFRNAQGEGEKDCVPSRDIGKRNSRRNLGVAAILRHIDVGSER